MNVSVGTHPFDILGLPCIDFQWMLLFSVYVITSLAPLATTVNHQSHFLGDEKNPSSPFSLIRVWKNENPVLESVYVLLLPCLFS